MNKQELTIAEFIYQCGLRINNSLEDEQIKQSVATLGYTTESLEGGRTLLNDSTSLCQAYDKEYGEVKEAYEARNKEKEKADKLFKKHQTIARVALKNNRAAITTLQLDQRMPRTISGWFARTRTFYSNLLDNTSWLEKMAQFNTTSEELTQGLSSIKVVENHMDVILREKGDAQNATKLRDAKLEELAEWINDYESIAELALADSPQLLEKLGIVVK
jgi:hypothetical protein